MSERETRGANEAIDFNDELRNRREKLAALRQQGVAFPNDFRRDHTSDQLHEEFDAKDNQELESLNIEVSVAGTNDDPSYYGESLLCNVAGCRWYVFNCTLQEIACQKVFITISLKNGIWVTLSVPAVRCLRRKRVSFPFTVLSCAC